MKYKIRKRQNVTLYMSSPVAELDDKPFKKLKDNPYTGNSEQEFLKYISSFDLWDIQGLDLKDDVKDELEKLSSNSEMNEFANSMEKGEDSWFESGEEDESYRRTGGFNVNFSSDE